MDRWLAVLMMGVAGGIVALSPPLNAGLGRAVGALPAAMLAFILGAVALTILVVLTGQISQIEAAPSVRWYYLLGGLCGAVWVATSIPAVKSIGAGGVVAATITGQLTAAVVVDRLGILELETVAITPLRVTGVLLLGLGTYLIVR